MKKTLLLLITALISYYGGAQENIKKNTFAINYGIGYITRQDLIFSPFIHKDFTAVDLGIEYSREAKFYQKIRFNYAAFNPMVYNSYQFT